MGRSRSDKPVMVWVMRSFLLLNFLSAVGFIVYALLLQNPPKTSLPLGLLIIGCCSLVACLIGLLGTLRVNCCLTIYLWLGGLLTLAELGITLSMFFNYGNTVDDLVRYDRKHSDNFTEADKQALKDKVKNGRWFFLVVCALQFVSVVVAVILRVCVHRRERDFQSFEDGEENGNGRGASSQIQLQKLQQSINGRQAQAPSPGTSTYASSKLSRSTTQKMAAKYGAYTSDADFKQKGWFARTFGR